MITSNLYSMSVKELCARLSVLLVMCAFAVSAKATPTIEPIAGEDKGYTITINEPADFDIFNSSDNVFYTEEDGTVIKVSEIKELAIVTTGEHKLDKPKATTLLNNCTSLDILDLENCDVAGVTETGGANPFLGNGHPNPFKDRLNTLVFPKTAGMIIPASAFKGDTKLKTVIFPDNKGTYEIMAYAFEDSNIETVSLGKGYTISDFAQQSNGQWGSDSGSGTGIFQHCAQLKNLVFDNSITNLGNSAFSATFALEYVVLPEELVHMGPFCFKESAIRTITIPDHCDLSCPNNSSPQIFQGCVRLTNIYLNTDNVHCDVQGVMEMEQTTNFKWNTEVSEVNPTYSVNDYTNSGGGTWHSSYSDCPFQDQHYTVPILHYPGTNTAIDNYRIPKYMHYSNVDPVTGTTWPKANEINPYESLTVDGVTYRGIDPYNVDGQSGFAGWRQFPLGNNIFKEQKVFYDERIKESRWYSICLPVNMTEAQFVNAYGVGAALNEFSGAVYDEENNMIVLKFDKPAEVKNGYLLQKNVPYMIHPAKIKFTKRKEVVLADPTNPNSGVVFEKVEGQEDYVTKEVIATFDVESDLFVNWDIVLNGGQPFGEAITAIQNATTNALIDNAVTQTFSHEKFSSVDFTFKGSYLGAEIYGPKDASGKYKVMGTSPKLPVGAYYLGYKEGMEKPQFFKAKGTATWTPYCALVESGTVTTGDGNEAKVLGVDFINSDVVVTKIGTPTIQIPMVKTDNKVYNLNGQVVRENSKDINGLKGIYVVGGKKVVFN